MLMYLVSSFLITIISYGILPCLFALLRKNTITTAKYRGICYSINLPVWIVYWLLSDGASSGAAYFLWSTVFFYVGRQILRKKWLLSDENHQKAMELQTNVEPVHPEPEVIPKLETAPREPKPRAASIRQIPYAQYIPYILIVLLLGVFLIRDHQLSARIDSLTAQISILQEENAALSDDLKSISIDYEEAYKKIKFLSSSVALLKSHDEKYTSQFLNVSDCITALYHKTGLCKTRSGFCIDCFNRVFE